MKKGLAWPGDPGKGVRSAYMPNFARLETENLALHQGMRETLFEISDPGSVKHQPFSIWSITKIDCQ